DAAMSFLKICPSFITNLICLRAGMLDDGSPATAIRSARNPEAIRPVTFPNPGIPAVPDVADTE
ncbi:MAG TPA: hypothetical protein VHM24_09740, partial [Gemmatimonadaceae bacterium]|nr:hypothetical protein [Gemmatimonadaceae bacterium]